eukprot:7269880-Prymnesium_polylepis.3
MAELHVHRLCGRILRAECTKRACRAAFCCEPRAGAEPDVASSTDIAIRPTNSAYRAARGRWAWFARLRLRQLKVAGRTATPTICKLHSVVEAARADGAACEPRDFNAA